MLILQEDLSYCTSCGWGGVNFLHGSLYSVVFKTGDQTSVDNTLSFNCCRGVSEWLCRGLSDSLGQPATGRKTLEMNKSSSHIMMIWSADFYSADNKLD